MNLRLAVSIACGPKLSRRMEMRTGRTGLLMILACVAAAGGSPCLAGCGGPAKKADTVAGGPGQDAGGTADIVKARGGDELPSVEDGPGIKDIRERSLHKAHAGKWKEGSLESLLKLAAELPAESPQDPGSCLDHADLLFEVHLKSLSDAGKVEVDFRARAIEAYAALIKNFPSFDRQDEALFCLGYLLEEIARMDPDKKEDYGQKARSVFLVIIKKFPASKIVAHTMLVFAEFYFDDGDFEKALQLYKKATQVAGSGIEGLILYKTAWCLLELKDYEASAETFQRLIDYCASHPDDPDAGALLKQAEKEIAIPAALAAQTP